MKSETTHVSGGCSARTWSMSTPNRDQNISECSTRRSENQEKACKKRGESVTNSAGKVVEQFPFVCPIDIGIYLLI